MFSTMINATELCTAMPDYNQRPKSQDGIHQLEILQYIKFWFLDVVFVRLSRMSVRWIWHPTKHAY